MDTQVTFRQKWNDGRLAFSNSAQFSDIEFLTISPGIKHGRICSYQQKEKKLEENIADNRQHIKTKEKYQQVNLKNKDLEV